MQKHGHQTAIQPPRTEPGPPPAPAGDPITYEDLQISLVLGRGIVVDTAPEHTKISVGVLANNPLGLTFEYPDGIRIAQQVGYEITGYDPDDCALTLRLVRDWRPGQKDDPNGDAQTEDTSDLDITPFLVVHHYRRDGGDWAWLYRCWGDGGCDGFLSLDWSSRTSAERQAREHLAGHPATALIKEG
jgi:hypothetical protein